MKKLILPTILLLLFLLSILFPNLVGAWFWFFGGLIFGGFIYQILKWLLQRL